jgi:hypothetical protein
MRQFGAAVVGYEENQPNAEQDRRTSYLRIPLDAAVPHPTTLMKLATRCGSAAVAGLNEALLAKAAGNKLLSRPRMRT